MQQLIQRVRPGMTFIELLLFIVIFSMVGTVMINLLFQSSESRTLQETEAQVEQNGAQMLQQIGDVIHNGSRVINPAVVGGTGTILAVEKPGYEYPVVFSLSGGYLTRTEGTTYNYVSSEQVSVSDFYVVNTSAGTGENSVLIRFTVSRVIRLSAPRSYSRIFEATFSLYTDEATDFPRHKSRVTAMLQTATEPAAVRTAYRFSPLSLW